MVSEIIILSIIIFVISLVFSMFGKGGGSLYLPVLISLTTISFHVAAGVSLFLIFIQGISMLFVFNRKHKSVDWFVAIVLAVIIGLFSFLGGFFSTLVSAFYLKILFAILLFISAGALFLNKKVKVIAKGFGVLKRTLGKTTYHFNILYLIIAVAPIGFLAGLVGTTGGGLIVPIAILFAGMPIRIAMGTNTVLILVASLMGFTGHLANGTFDWYLGGVLSIAIIFGSQIGAHLHAKIDENMLRIGLSAILIFAALLMIFKMF